VLISRYLNGSNGSNNTCTVITTLTIVRTDLSQVPGYRTLHPVPGDSARSAASWHRVIKQSNLNKRNLLEETTMVLLAKNICL